MQLGSFLTAMTTILSLGVMASPVAEHVPLPKESDIFPTRQACVTWHKYCHQLADGTWTGL